MSPGIEQTVTPVYYLRRLKHYIHAPVGAVVCGEDGEPQWEKVEKNLWVDFWNTETANNFEMAGTRRRVHYWPGR